MPATQEHQEKHNLFTWSLADIQIVHTAGPLNHHFSSCMYGNILSGTSNGLQET